MMNEEIDWDWEYTNIPNVGLVPQRITDSPVWVKAWKDFMYHSDRQVDVNLDKADPLINSKKFKVLMGRISHLKSNPLLNVDCLDLVLDIEKLLEGVRDFIERRHLKAAWWTRWRNKKLYAAQLDSIDYLIQRVVEVERSYLRSLQAE